MIRRTPSLVGLLALSATLAGAQVDLGTEAQQAEGKQLYEKYCSQCHGVNGDGNGPATPALYPKPRDFTSGKYKIRSTPSGALPTHRDLENIIRRGMPYTSMPGWDNFSESQLDSLVYYLKTFNEDFANAERVVPADTFASAPPFSRESAEKGRKVYEDLGCIRCHGELGRGDGMSAPTLVDDWGNHLRPANMTQKWTFRGGATREDLFRVFSTGLNGTPMPSYKDAVDDASRWNLVDYVYALSDTEEAPYRDYVTVRAVEEPIDLQLDIADVVAQFDGAEPAMFPIVGQITEPGRNFQPLVTAIDVTAIYNRQEIAFMLQWDDMLADTGGGNSPTLEVEPFDWAAAAPATAAGDDEGDFWGDEDAGEEDFWGEEEDDSGGDDFWGEEEDAGDDFWGEEDDAEAAPAGPGASSKYSDAVAIQMPVAPLEDGYKKPYFIFGDANKPVDIWFTEMTGRRAQRFTGQGSDNVTETDAGELEVVSAYDNGRWTVVFKRALRPIEGRAIGEQDWVPVAFSTWDGFREDHGNQRGLTQWFWFFTEPRTEISAAGPMTRTALTVLVVQLVLIFLIRRRYAGKEA